jgi:branched-chain amino acid aminotransferase
MSIKAFQVTQKANLPLNSNASTLDEMTRELPQGFYTTFSTLSHGTKVLGFHAHLQRLYAPAQEMGLNPAVDESTLRGRIADLVKENLPKESRVRLILAKESGAIYIGIQYFEPLPEIIYSKGVKVITTELARKAPRVKDTGFISSSVSQREQIGNSVFEVLLTENGKILEGMTSNFYGITGKSLITAQRGILLGVTRKAILRLARGQGMSIKYRSARVDENFNEAFLTSSSRGVVPIISIDDKPVGKGVVGKWTKTLSKAYQAYVHERSELII